VGSRAGLDVCEKSRPHRDSIPGLSSPSSFAIPTELPGPQTEMSTRNISWGKGGRCVGLTNLLLSCDDCLEIWGLNLLEPSGPLQACNGIALPYVNSPCELF
jgi:hypothetical protein